MKPLSYFLFRLLQEARVWGGRFPRVCSSLSVNASRTLALKGIHSGRRAVIVGNGPSLRVSDLERFGGDISFAANKIYLAFESTKWRPSYYNVEDPKVIAQTFKEINLLSGFPKLLKRGHGNVLKGDKWTIFYDLVVLRQSAFPCFSGDPLRGVYCGYSVCLSSMQWAYYMGIKEIVLVGVDFNFVVPNRDASGTIVSVGEQNHFLPGYRPVGEKWEIPRLEEQEIAFRYARSWLEERGVKVINATRGGKLEVFERRDFDEVFPAK